MSGERCATGVLLTFFAVIAMGGCASEPVKEIKGIFQRATEGSAATESESKGEIKAESEGESESEARVEPEPAPATTQPESKESPELLAGIKAYEDGRYRDASKMLRSALPQLNKPEKVKAHKYLAFIECASGRKNQCRTEFARALKIDPAFELEPAEAGHPSWGPVFRSVKQTRKR